jgi:hypothetical protein
MKPPTLPAILALLLGVLLVWLTLGCSSLLRYPLVSGTILRHAALISFTYFRFRSLYPQMHPQRGERKEIEKQKDFQPKFLTLFSEIGVRCKPVGPRWGKGRSVVGVASASVIGTQNLRNGTLEP